jgi:tetratricopeptide (TPR) repeat protein
MSTSSRPSANPSPPLDRSSSHIREHRARSTNLFTDRFPGLWRWASLILLLLAPVPTQGEEPVEAGSGGGGDRVVVRPRLGTGGHQTLRGVIEDSTGARITLREAGGRRVRVIPLSDYQVVELRTTFVPAHERGLAALARRDLPAAESALAEALDDESRRWVRREILAARVRIALVQDNQPLAARLFFSLYESDSTTPHLTLIPLKWTAGDPPTESVRPARDWLASTQLAAQLVGASLLLEHPEYRAEAVKTVQSVAAGEDRRLAELAAAQLWRPDLQAARLSDLQLQRWEQRVSQLPPELRSGPAFLLGRAYSTRSQGELAAAWFLWPATVGGVEGELAAQGLIEAGGCLARIGQSAEAIRLWREAQSRFPDSTWARAAADRERLERETGAGP